MHSRPQGSPRSTDGRHRAARCLHRSRRAGGVRRKGSGLQGKANSDSSGRYVVAPIRRTEWRPCQCTDPTPVAHGPRFENSSWRGGQHDGLGVGIVVFQVFPDRRFDVRDAPGEPAAAVVLVINPKKRSTWLIREAEVGVKCTWSRLSRLRHDLTLGFLRVAQLAAIRCASRLLGVSVSIRRGHLAIPGAECLRTRRSQDVHARDWKPGAFSTELCGDHGRPTWSQALVGMQCAPYAGAE